MEFEAGSLLRDLGGLHLLEPESPTSRRGGGHGGKSTDSYAAAPLHRRRQALSGGVQRVLCLESKHPE